MPRTIYLQFRIPLAAGAMAALFLGTPSAGLAGGFGGHGGGGLGGFQARPAMGAPITSPQRTAPNAPQVNPGTRMQSDTQARPAMPIVIPFPPSPTAGPRPVTTGHRSPAPIGPHTPVTGTRVPTATPTNPRQIDPPPPGGGAVN